MIGPGTGVRVYLAYGITDMREGIEDLAAAATVSLATNIRLQARYGSLDRRQIGINSAVAAVPTAGMLASVLLLGDVLQNYAMQRLPSFPFEVFAGAIAYLAILLLIQRITGRSGQLLAR